MKMKTFDIFPIKGGVCAPKGFFADGLSAGFKPNNALVVAFIYMQKTCIPTAIFDKQSFLCLSYQTLLCKSARKREQFCAYQYQKCQRTDRKGWG